MLELWIYPNKRTDPRTLARICTLWTTDRSLVLLVCLGFNPRTISRLPTLKYASFLFTCLSLFSFSTEVSMAYFTHTFVLRRVQVGTVSCVSSSYRA
jgi:hypothetical protein